MTLRITTQNALIGISSSNGQFHIQQNQQPMRLSTTKGQLFIKSEEAVLLIDQQRCFSEAGLKTSAEITREGAAKGKRAALQGTARIASEGKEMADIHRGKAIPRQAARRLRKNPQVNFDMIPKSRPEITVIKGEIRTSYQKGRVDIALDDIKPRIQYQRGQLDIYLRQKNDISIEFVGNILDVYGG